MFKVTTATEKVSRLSKRIRAIPGGTSASKTISILLYLIARAQTDKTTTLTSVVAESFPHLRRGAMRDFLTIMQEHRYFDDKLWDKTNSVYTFETGSKIEFFSVDQPEKVRGARRDRLFINEANNIPFTAFEELEVRTKEFIFLDWNPTNSFWYYEEVKGKRDDVEELTLTYKDNEALSQEIVDSIETRKERKSWWQVYGLGQLGEIEGRIYTGWNIIDSIPFEARLERYGMDFGYTNDPSAIVAIYYFNGGYILDEILFQKGLSNKQLADTLLNLRKALVIADSAEPKSIDEIRSFGVNIQPCEKGKDSVRQGIQMVQDQQISVTKQSINIIKEYRNYLWSTDKEGRTLNEPEHLWSHCFAPETLVHTIDGQKRIDELVGKEGLLYTRDNKIRRFYNVHATRRNAEVVTLMFNDGDSLTVTPDHLLLLPNNEWIEAGLLCSTDRIQSATYESPSRTIFRRPFFLQVFGQQVLQGLREWKTLVDASVRLALPQWAYSTAPPCASQGRESGQQFHIQSRIETQGHTFKRSHDTREARTTTEMGGQNPTASQQVAWVKRGEGMAQVTWTEVMEHPCTAPNRMWSLSSWLSRFSRKILRRELQNESTTKTIKRISRGFRAITYNLEVEGTHCLLANGVIAHNSMDAIRYGMSSLLPMIQRRDMQAQMPRFAQKERVNPAY